MKSNGPCNRQGQSVSCLCSLPFGKCAPGLRTSQTYNECHLLANVNRVLGITEQMVQGCCTLRVSSAARLCLHPLAPAAPWPYVAVTRQMDSTSLVSSSAFVSWWSLRLHTDRGRGTAMRVGAFVCRTSTDMGQRGRWGGLASGRVCGKVRRKALSHHGRKQPWASRSAHASLLSRAESSLLDRTATMAHPVRKKASLTVCIGLWYFWVIPGVFNPVTAVVSGRRTTLYSTGSLRPVMYAQWVRSCNTAWELLHCAPCSVLSQKSREF